MRLGKFLTVEESTDAKVVSMLLSSTQLRAPLAPNSRGITTTSSTLLRMVEASQPVGGLRHLHHELHLATYDEAS
jgi:hypothetical protein